MMKKYKIELNNSTNIELLLQELYDESCENINEIQREINRLTNSVNLSEETMDSKAKYAKSINDFITNKGKAISTKLDIAKLMTEVLKHNGNVKKAFEDESSVGDWEELKKQLEEKEASIPQTKERKVYKI